MSPAAARPLRIGIFVMTFPQRSETFIVTKVIKLLEAGFDVHIISMQASPHWESFAVLADRPDIRARVHVLPPTRDLLPILGGATQLARRGLFHPRRFARYLTHNWRVRKRTPLGFAKATYLRSVFLELELDILHVEFDAQGVGVADLKAFLDCHVLYSARGMFQMLSVLDTTPDACRYLFRYADGYHFISRALERNTHQLGLDPDVPTWLIEPAIDLTLFTPRPRSHSEVLRLISVGRLSWEKGYEFAIDAVAKVRDAGIDVDYRIYGAGPYSDPIRYAIRQHGLEAQVRLAGALPREAMPGVYAEADVMVHAAVGEGFCNAVVEAQAMELPVVTSDAGGLPENVDHDVTGFVVPRRDATAMADRIIELARDPGRRARMGAAGRLRALARYNLDDQAAAFVGLYRELHARPRRPISGA